MSIMRALKNVGIGYLQGSTDIMAQKAKEKTEAQRLADERAFQAQLQKDKILQTKLANLEIEELKNSNKSKDKIAEQEKFILEKRDQLSNQGWNNEFLDIATTQGHLNSDTNWSVFYNKYNAFMFDRTGSPDWHLEKDKNGLNFQQLYVNEYNKFISNDGSNFSMEDSLNKENNISSNTAKVLLSPERGDGEFIQKEIETAQITPDATTDATTDTTTDTTPDATGDTTKVTTEETTDGSFKAISDAGGYLSGFNKKSYPSQLFITDVESPNWAFTNAPKSALVEGEMIVLTLNADKTGYTYKTQKIAETYNQIQQGVTQRDKDIVNAIYDNKGLFNEFEDMAQFMKGGQIDTKAYFAQNAEKQALFVNIYSYATILDGSYQSQEKFARPQSLIQNAIKLSKLTNKDTGFAYAKEAKKQGAENTNNELEVALSGINNVLSSVKNSLIGLDMQSETGQNSKRLLQQKALREFKHHFALGYVDESNQGVFASTTPEYKEAAKIIDDIIADIGKGEEGNRGRYWIEKEVFDSTKPSDRQPGLDPDATPEPEPEGVPSSIKDGITTYDLSGLPKDEDSIQEIKNVDFVKTQKYNQKATEQTGYTYILKDGSQITVMPGDIINVRGRNRIVNIAQYGEEGNKPLLLQTYSGSVKGNPNRTLLDSKINELNKVEKSTPPTGTGFKPVTEEDKADWTKNKENKIAILKKEIEELYNKIKG